MTWLTWASIVGLTDVVYNMGYKAASTRMSGLVYILVLNVSIVFWCIMGLLVQRTRGEAIVWDTPSWHIPLLLGGIVCLMEFANYMTYARNAPFTLANPLMTVIISLTTLIVGYFFYQERLQPLNYLGLALCVTGVVLLTHKQVQP